MSAETQTQPPTNQERAEDATKPLPSKATVNSLPGRTALYGGYGDLDDPFTFEEWKPAAADQAQTKLDELLVHQHRVTGYELTIEQHPQRADATVHYGGTAMRALDYIRIVKQETEAARAQVYRFGGWLAVYEHRVA